MKWAQFLVSDVFGLTSLFSKMHLAFARVCHEFLQDLACACVWHEFVQNIACACVVCGMSSYRTLLVCVWHEFVLHMFFFACFLFFAPVKHQSSPVKYQSSTSQAPVKHQSSSQAPLKHQSITSQAPFKHQSKRYLGLYILNHLDCILFLLSGAHSVSSAPLAL
jgi:hypothetical protein